MLVELIGPAGAGKTSTAKRAEALLRRRGIDVFGFERLERLESEIGTRSFKDVGGFKRRTIIGGLLLRRPDLLLPILLLSWLYGPEASTGSIKRRRQRTRRVIGHVRLALSLRSMPHDRVVLLHEGFTQVLWTLLIDSPGLKATRLIRFVLARYHAAIGAARGAHRRRRCDRDAPGVRSGRQGALQPGQRRTAAARLSSLARISPRPARSAARPHGRGRHRWHEPLRLCGGRPGGGRRKPF